MKDDLKIMRLSEPERTMQSEILENRVIDAVVKQRTRDSRYLAIMMVIFSIFITMILTRAFLPVVVEKYVEVQVKVPVEVRVEVPVVDDSYAFINHPLPTKISGSFKSYMDYRAITNTASDQYALQRLANTDASGFRELGGRYLVAMGTYYAKYVGQIFRITLASEKVFWVTIGDVKQGLHTNATGQYVVANGNIVEFIVDTKLINAESRLHGDISYAGFEGAIVKIEEVIHQH